MYGRKYLLAKMPTECEIKPKDTGTVTSIILHSIINMYFMIQQLMYKKFLQPNR